MGEWNATREGISFEKEKKAIAVKRVCGEWARERLQEVDGISIESYPMEKKSLQRGEGRGGDYLYSSGGQCSNTNKKAPCDLFRKVFQKR